MRQYHRPQQRSMTHQLSASQCAYRTNVLSTIHATNADLLGHAAVLAAGTAPAPVSPAKT